MMPLDMTGIGSRSTIWLLLSAIACGDTPAPSGRVAEPSPSVAPETKAPSVTGGGPAHNYVEVVAKDGSIRRKTEMNGWLLLEALLTEALGRGLTADQRAIVADYGRQRVAGWWPPAVVRAGRGSHVFGRAPPLPNDLDDTCWNLALRGERLRLDELKGFLTQEPPARTDGAVLCERAKVSHDVVLRTWEGADAGWRGDIDVVVIANALTRLDGADTEQATLFAHNARLVNQATVEGEPERFAPNYDAAMTAFLLLYYDDQAHFLSSAAREALLGRWRSLQTALTQTVACYGPCAQPALIDGHVYRYVNEAIPVLAKAYAARWH